jgi:glycosyltransferase involved in cell wall biosynthesis
MQATGFKKNRLSTGPPAVARAPAGHDSAGRVGLVSVIIPAYNEAAAAERALSSVRNPTYSDLDMQVADDGSADEIAAIVRRRVDIAHQITLLQKPNAGPASARNHGIAHAGAEFIALIDAGDLWHPENIRPGAFVKARRRGGAANAAANCNFLELTVLCGCPRASWNRNRLADTAVQFIGPRSCPIRRRSPFA